MNTTFKAVFDAWSGNAELDEDPTTPCIDFDIQDVKWYPSYTVIADFKRMLLDLEELGFCYEFIRLGEEHDDIESESSGNSDGRLRVSVSVERSY
jgi:hypothetical protein